MVAITQEHEINPWVRFVDTGVREVVEIKAEFLVAFIEGTTHADAVAELAV